MAKFTLEPEYDFEFMLFAIHAHIPDYQLCFSLNQNLHLDLVREMPVELKNKNQEEALQFSLYQYSSEDDFLDYDLVSNKSYNRVRMSPSTTSNQADLFGESNEESTLQLGYLLPELDKPDFLFMVRTPYDPDLAELIEKQIKEISDVIRVQYIDPQSLSSKKNLIF